MKILADRVSIRLIPIVSLVFIIIGGNSKAHASTITITKKGNDFVDSSGSVVRKPDETAEINSGSTVTYCFMVPPWSTPSADINLEAHKISGDGLDVEQIWHDSGEYGSEYGDEIDLYRILEVKLRAVYPDHYILKEIEIRFEYSSEYPYTDYYMSCLHAMMQCRDFAKSIKQFDIWTNQEGIHSDWFKMWIAWVASIGFDLLGFVGPSSPSSIAELISLTDSLQQTLRDVTNLEFMGVAVDKAWMNASYFGPYPVFASSDRYKTISEVFGDDVATKFKEFAKTWIGNDNTERRRKAQELIEGLDAFYKMVYKKRL